MYEDRFTVDEILEAADALRYETQVPDDIHPMIFFGLNVFTMEDLGLQELKFDLPRERDWDDELAREFVEYYNKIQLSNVDIRPDPLDSKKLLITA